jgi:hypothetical protein
MKILVTKEEIQKIVIEHLIAKGIPIRKDSAAVKTHVEGDYEDAKEIFDGVTVEIEES